ncbi:hypothetical protein BDF21DRAFT_397806 [Thamnidium elegans]|nr:hypothetical protein BDF21DRAFT_397806 [Thamnidium elegans]
MYLVRISFIGTISNIPIIIGNIFLFDKTCHFSTKLAQLRRIRFIGEYHYIQLMTRLKFLSSRQYVHCLLPRAEIIFINGCEAENKYSLPYFFFLWLLFDAAVDASVDAVVSVFVRAYVVNTKNTVRIYIVLFNFRITFATQSYALY